MSARAGREPNPGAPDLRSRKTALLPRARAEDGIDCPPRIEDVGAQLTCRNLPGGSYWHVRQGPTCLVAEWNQREHREVCAYDPRTGKLIASRGQDACGMYCNGLRAVQFGEYLPEGCGNTRFVAAARCLEDGTEVPDPRPQPSIDAGARDRHPDNHPPVLDGGPPVDAGPSPLPRPLDARRSPDARTIWPPTLDTRFPTPAPDARIH